MGVDVARYKLQAFVISAVYASVSGSLIALQNKFVTPDMAGYMHSIELVIMAVLGGAGSVLGAFFGAAILTLLQQVLTIFAEYEQIMLGLVMMLENVIAGFHLTERGSLVADLFSLPASRRRARMVAGDAMRLLERVGLARAAEQEA